MTSIREIIKKSKNSGWLFPAALLALFILTYGLLLPDVGYYWDDWETALVHQQFGISEYWRYFDRDRPLAAWTYMVFAPLAGVRPFNWQILTFTLRYLTVIAMGWVLVSIWPDHKKQAQYAAFLFAVYPVFLQQYISMSYHQHWTQYLLMFVSLGLMIQAVKPRQSSWHLTTLSILAFFLNASVTEYFIGLELLRPIILWLVIRSQDSNEHPKKTAGRILLRWLPYLVALGIFLAWRFFYLAGAAEGVNRPTLIYNLFKNPAEALVRLAQISLQDTIFVLAASWYKLLDPKLITFTQPVIMISWGVALISAAGVFWYFSQLEQEKSNLPENSSRWLGEITIFGTLALLLGGLSVWATDRQVSNVMQYTDRFGLVMMFGASLLLTASLEWLIKNGWRKTLLLALMVGLCSGLHLRTANDFRWSWVRQMRIYWQLAWRAPQIEPQTTLLSDGDIVSFVRPTYPINLLYNQPVGSRQLAYAFYILREVPDLSSQTQYKIDYRNFTYAGNGNNSLVIYYNPPQTNCVWILSPADRDDPLLPASLKQVLPLSNLARIKTEAEPTRPPPVIFGTEPEHDWCYFFEQADLARQAGRWKRIVELGDQAIQAGYRPNRAGSNTPHEWLPFIEGYAHQDHWEQAKDLTITSFQREPKYREFLCKLWENLLNEIPSGSQNRTTGQEITRQLECAAR